MAAVVLALVTGLAAPVAGASTRHRHRVARLSSMLLEPAKMPAGWRLRKSGSGSTATSGCLAPKGMPKTVAHASRAFAKGGSIPELVEDLVVFEDLSAKTFRVDLEHLSDCRALTFRDDGKRVRATAQKMSLPRLGAQSAAYAFSFPVGGIKVGIDALIARKGHVALLLMEADFGSPNVGQFEHFAKTAMARVRRGL